MADPAALWLRSEPAFIIASAGGARGYDAAQVASRGHCGTLGDGRISPRSGSRSHHSGGKRSVCPAFPHSGRRRVSWTKGRVRKIARSARSGRVVTSSTRGAGRARGTRRSSQTLDSISFFARREGNPRIRQRLHRRHGRDSRAKVCTCPSA
jgi:hypothetical protein